MSQKKRNLAIESFQNDLNTKYIVVSLNAGGTGINLIRAQAVVMFDLWWNPAKENQAIDRAYRLGQENDVNVYRFITKGTLEERINEMLIKKRDLAYDCVDKISIMGLKDDELNDIFSISALH